MYRKIGLSQLPRETKTQRHHTTASHDITEPDDLVYPCAKVLQDMFSADAPCTEVIVGQWHPLSCHCRLRQLQSWNEALYSSTQTWFWSPCTSCFCSISETSIALFKYIYLITLINISIFQIHKIVQGLHAKKCVYTFGEVKNTLGTKLSWSTTMDFDVGWIRKCSLRSVTETKSLKRHSNIQYSCSSTLTIQMIQTDSFKLQLT